MPIQREAFETWEELILSGQIPQENVPGLLHDNPEFRSWYRERARERQQ